MKKLAYSSLFIILFVTVAAAQAPVVSRVAIPFSFNAHEQTYDAGAYELRRVGHQTVRLQNAKGDGITLLSAQNVAGDDDVKLIFRIYPANHQFLASVAAPNFHISLPKSKEELEIVATGQKPRIVEMVARR